MLQTIAITLILAQCPNGKCPNLQAAGPIVSITIKPETKAPPLACPCKPPCTCLPGKCCGCGKADINLILTDAWRRPYWRLENGKWRGQGVCHPQWSGRHRRCRR